MVKGYMKVLRVHKACLLSKVHRKKVTATDGTVVCAKYVSQ